MTEANTKFVPSDEPPFVLLPKANTAGKFVVGDDARKQFLLPPNQPTKAELCQLVRGVIAEARPDLQTRRDIEYFTRENCKVYNLAELAQIFGLTEKAMTRVIHEDGLGGCVKFD